MNNSKAAVLITATVVVHGIAVLLHAGAHTALSVDMTWLQNAFIVLVIMATPIVAAVLAWTRYSRLAAMVLGASMLGALVFGGYHHFLEKGIDNVAGVPTHGWGMTFRLTAVALVALEAWGIVAAVVALRLTRRLPA